MSKNHSQKEKQKTTAIRISKLSFVLLTSAVQLLTANSNIVAFAAVNCDEPIETDGTIEQTCVGGTSYHDEFTGGEGAHSTCTYDSSTLEIQSCSTSGGRGGTFEEETGLHAGGGGGSSDCTSDPDAGEWICSYQVGGSGSKPVPDEVG